MKDNLQIELLGKLAAEKEVTRLLKERKRDDVTESIRPQHLAAYQEDGWKLDKEFKYTVRVKKEKPLDIKFEDEVWSLFAQLGFNFLNRDRQFHLPYDKNKPELTQQIDVFAKDEETVILVECKTAETEQIGDFKQELEAMAGKIEGLRNSISELFPNVKHKIKYILATKNLKLNEGDNKRLENLHGTYFNEKIIEYFFDLQSQLGSASKYQLLGLLFEGQDIPELDNRVPAVQGSMGGHKYYSFSIEPEKLLKIGFVLHQSKANEAMRPTYQRIIKKARLKAVHKFVDEEQGYFPNSIVVSIEASKPKDCRFEPANTQVPNTKSSAGILHLPKKYRSAYIIDGQHRLYGYANSKYGNSNTIPVVAFINLERQEQIRLFMQINENQKSVAKNLQHTLNADLLRDSKNYLEQRKALCASVGIALGENESSPLFSKVAIGEDIAPITIQPIENALRGNGFLGKVSKTEIEELGTLYNGNFERSFKRITQFLILCLNYVAINVQEEWQKSDGMLVINKGIYGLIRICGDIVTHLNQTRVINSRKASPQELFDETKTFLDPVINYLVDLDAATKAELKQALGSSAAEWYWRLFQRAVKDTFEDFNPQAMAAMEKWFRERDKIIIARAKELVQEIETYFNADFKEKLEERFGSQWFKKGVPPEIAKPARDLAYDKNREVEDEADEVSDWDCLYLINYRVIAEKNWRDIFENHYTFPGEEKINGGAKAKTKWMERLNRVRNGLDHVPPKISDEDLSFLEQLEEWLIKKELRNKYQLNEG